jgi:chromodomain-helicase-DNA-binding protein 7
MEVRRDSSFSAAHVFDANSSDFSSDDEVSLTRRPPTPKEPHLVQQVLGIQGTEDTVDLDAPVYYVKWTGKSYIHCSWVPRAELLALSGGHTAIRKFESRSKSFALSQSLSLRTLMTYGNNDFNSLWTTVDRVIGYRASDGLYLVKWAGQNYDGCTWEEENNIADNAAITKFYSRMDISHPTRIPSGRRNVAIQQFAPYDDPLQDTNGVGLRPYQVQGYNWLRFCWFQHCNSILADEMGLGKTLQVVAALRDIAINHHIGGPFLVLAPLSTLPHWKGEFERWSDLYPVVFHGSRAAKEIIKEYEVSVHGPAGDQMKNRVRFDVLIANYETLVSDFNFFKDIEWRYLVLDEGHRLKNHTGKCYQMLQQLRFEHCTLLTGTPIQNNVEELWSLLHFLHPQQFDDLPGFLEKYRVIDDAKTLASLQKLIKPYLLRRKKSDVDATIATKEETIIEVELTQVQKAYYKALLHENAPTLLAQITGGALPSLLNLMMQLRKVCNHPFLLKGVTEHVERQVAEKLGKQTIDEEVQLRSLVDSSGKLILVDKLLKKLKAGSHKVLIFSQMVKVIDILEEYCALVGYPTERIDGSVPGNDRQDAIERFAHSPGAFVFLLCTRAGGVGINLTAADTVIIYDSDWNPQNDIQAESRCHRIGQTAQVKIYRLVTRGTYELQMLDRASKKLGLDHALLDGGEVTANQKPMAAKEIEKLLRTGVYDLTNDDDTEIENFCAADIDQILERRSKAFAPAIVSCGDSVFSKAKFDAEGDGLDLESKAFWKSAIGKLEDKVEALPDRRCKQQKANLKFTETVDKEEERRVRKKKLIVQTNPKTITQRIMRYGYAGTQMEKALILYALSKEPMPEYDSVFHQILEGTDLSQRLVQIETKFKPSIETLDRIEILLQRVVFHFQLTQVLGYVQGPLTSWPSFGSTGDPQTDYALMFGIHLNGLGSPQRVLENVSFEATRPLTENSIWKTVSSIVSALAPAASLVARLPGQFSDPHDWKEEHEELFSCTEIAPNKLVSLFQTLVSLGFPETPDGEVDWSRIERFAHLDDISTSIVSQTGGQILQLARDRLSGPEQAELLQRLGAYGNKIWISRLKNNTRDLGIIRSCLARWNSTNNSTMKRIRRWEAAPEWWSLEYDLALLHALAEYGILLVFPWLVDPDRPFRIQIPAKFIPEFQRFATLELKTGRPQKPRNVTEFTFLLSEKARMSRALAICQFVEAHPAITTNESEPDEPELMELPPLPLEIGHQLIIDQFGEFTLPTAQYPVGFVSRREYFSVLDPTEHCWYESSTELGPEGKLQYRVRALVPHGPEYTYHTSSGCWEHVIQDLQMVRTQKGLPKRRGTSVSGPWMYGLSSPLVVSCFKLMRK